MNLIIAVTIILWIFEVPNYGSAAPRLKEGSRIVGGAPVNIEDYPYQVAVLLYDYHFCGGSIIAPKWILTAAHCMLEIFPEMYSIRAGSSYHASGGVTVPAHSIYIHPRFNKVNLANDIALILLRSPLINQTGIQPITLPAANTNIPSGIYATATGWGKIRENGPDSNHLRGVIVPIVTRAACVSTYGTLPPNVLCAGFASGGRGTCQGDSGGPLVAKDYGQIGIVSGGIGCAGPGFYGVYASVPALRAWITEVSGI